MASFTFDSINFWGVLAGVLFNFILGSFWFGPVFGDAWFENSRWSKKGIEKAKAQGMSLNFIGTAFQSIIMNIFLIALIESVHATYKFDWIELSLFLVLIWAALLLPTGLQGFLWEGEKPIYFLINQSNRLASILVPGLFYYCVLLN